MTGKPHTGNPASPAGQRAHTMPGQRVVNLLVRAMLRLTVIFLGSGRAYRDDGPA